MTRRMMHVEKRWLHSGIFCAVVQSEPHRFRCGYVRIPPFHPAFNLNYDDIGVDVHGGLTFGQTLAVEEFGVAGHWIGFDTAHCFDVMYEPGYEPDYVKQFYSKDHKKFWTLPMICEETEKLADQIAAMRWSVRAWYKRLILSMYSRVTRPRVTSHGK